LSSEIVLEAGSGSGRFTKHVAETGAMVVSFDYSDAVKANYQSNGNLDNVLIVQADIFNMPFEDDFFDKVMCIGVLQHTPNPRNAFSSLVQAVKPGGAITVDNYIKDIGRYWLQPKYWVRPFTKNIDPEKLYPRLKAYVDFMWPLARLIRKIPVIGPTINWKLLIADYSRELPDADEATLKEWAYLDTFDMLSPAYDYPVTVSTFRKWFEEEGLQQIEVHKGYNGVEGRGRKPMVENYKTMFVSIGRT
jgi:SAM-dependent methyltransferase